MDLKRGLTGKALFVPSPCFFLMSFSSVGKRNYFARVLLAKIIRGYLFMRGGKKEVCVCGVGGCHTLRN